jgi:hypothetical protein
VTVFGQRRVAATVDDLHIDQVARRGTHRRGNAAAQGGG